MWSGCYEGWGERVLGNSCWRGELRRRGMLRIEGCLSGGLGRNCGVIELGGGWGRRGVRNFMFVEQECILLVF